MIPHLYYYQRILATGEVTVHPWHASHFREAGVSPMPLGGMPILEAFQLVNKWNISQTPQRYVYGLEV